MNPCQSLKSRTGLPEPAPPVDIPPMPSLVPLPDLLIEPVVRGALLEDLGRTGDLTTSSLIPPDTATRGAIVAREGGVIAGVGVATLAFRLLDPTVECETVVPDGGSVAAGQPVIRLRGPAGAILTGERVALNFLGRLSGVATATRRLVDAVRGTEARIVCTRKTTPGLRSLEKYAVRAGGGQNHRFGLDDGILIKDNHIAVVGTVLRAVERARERAGHMVRVQVEVDSIEQLHEALAAGADAVLLDNMSVSQLTEAVTLIARRAVTEASGGVTLDRAATIAATGVNLISSGAITHSAPWLDVGLDLNEV